ncbi:MAG: PEP-CTERM sorting domain-containing protein [Myxococcota bacterium]
MTVHSFSSRRLRGIVIAATLVGLSLVLSFSAAQAREPNEYEQYMVELVNRARLDPEGEVALLSTGSLNEGPPTLGSYPYTIPAGPKQPVAIHTEVIDAASDYAQALNDVDQFCHSCLGSSAESRMTDAGYVPALSDFAFFSGVAGYTLAYGGAQDPGCTGGCPIYVPGRENLSFRGEGPPNGMIDNLLAAVDQAHVGLFNDFTVPTRGHRSTMMYGEWREVGIGMNEGLDNGGSFDSLYIVQDFAHRSDVGPFLTGVAYDDVDEDGFYTPAAGEALGGVLVTVYEAGTANLAGTATTMTAGGYKVELPVGNYDVVVSGTGISESYTDVAILGSGPGGIGENTKLDFIPVPEPAMLLSLGAGSLFLAMARRRREQGC